MTRLTSSRSETKPLFPRRGGAGGDWGAILQSVWIRDKPGRMMGKSMRQRDKIATLWKCRICHISHLTRIPSLFASHPPVGANGSGKSNFFHGGCYFLLDQPYVHIGIVKDHMYRQISLCQGPSTNGQPVSNPLCSATLSQSLSRLVTLCVSSSVCIDDVSL